MPQHPAQRTAHPVVRLGLLLGLAAAALPACRTPGTGDPTPPGGGRAYVLDYDAYVATVAPVLTARGCDTVACHGGGIRGTFALSPAADKDFTFDFDQAALQVDPADPAASPLLQKPLDEAAGGAAHAGSQAADGFAGTDDPDYQAILAWIEAGEYR